MIQLSSRSPASSATRLRKRNNLKHLGRRFCLAGEGLEQRLMLTNHGVASIAGTVYEDTNDNGIFEEGIDVPLVGAQLRLTLEGDSSFSRTQNSASDGSYRFEGLSEGSYTLTQSPVDGLSQRPDEASVVIEISEDEAAGRGGPQLDAFDTTVSVMAVPGMNPDFDFVRTAEGEALGGEREVSAELTSSVGEINLRVNPDGNSALTLDSGSSSMGNRSVIWDGTADNGRPGIDFGLDADMTVLGINAVAITVSFIDIPTDLALRFYEDINNYSEAIVSLPGLILDVETTFIVPYEEFTNIGNGADFTRVTAVELLADEMAPAVDLRVDGIEFLIPNRVDFANVELGIAIEKATNGEDADSPPGPSVLVGEQATFSYEVTNPGGVALQITSIIDDNGTPNDSSDDFAPDPNDSGGFNSGDANRNQLLDTDETWTYSSSRQVTEGQYTNRVVVTGEDPEGAGSVEATDVSNHFGSTASITLEKRTNGVLVSEPTGPLIAVDGTATFDYTISNGGNVPLEFRSLTDDNGTPGTSSDDFSPPPIENDGFNVGDTNRNDLIDTNEVWQFQETRTVTPGQYNNRAVGIAADPESGTVVDDTAESYHFGSQPGIELMKFTNGQDANVPPGPTLAVGEQAVFTYRVRNVGNVALVPISLIDDAGSPDNSGDDFSPDPVLGDDQNNIGDTNGNGLLDLTEEWQFEATRNVVAGPYENTAVASAREDETGEVVNDSDVSNHFGAVTGIDIQTSTNGEDADSPTGPLVAVGTQVDWDYQVSNTGNVPLDITLIRDDNGTPEDESDDFTPNADTQNGFNVGDVNQNRLLDTDEVWSYSASRSATEGQYTNTGRVAAIFSELESEVSDADPTNHFGFALDVVVEKSTNGEDADFAPGPFVPVGSTVSFDYDVTNAGNVSLQPVSLIDDNGTPDDESDDFRPDAVHDASGFNVGDVNQNRLLDMDEVWRFAATRTAAADQYRNSATFTAEEPTTGETITASDVSHHFGAIATVSIEKSTNGEDADTPTGPLVPAGNQVTFDYLVNNDGNVSIEITSIVDDNGTPADTSDDFTPDPVLGVSGFNIGDLNRNELVDLDETWSYRATTTATTDQYTNVATVTSVHPASQATGMANDPSNHFGTSVIIQLEKSTNGNDADEAPGPSIPVDDTATFDYRLENLGNVSLAFASLTDDNGTPGNPSDDFQPSPVLQGNFNIGDTNQNELIDVGEVWRYESTRTVTAGPYANEAVAVAVEPETSQQATDNDVSHHLGSDPQVRLVKQTNGEQANEPPGVFLRVGETATFTYLASNVGNVPLVPTRLVDDNGTPDIPSDDFSPDEIQDSNQDNVGDTNGNGLLDPGEEWQYEASKTVVAGPYQNVATFDAQEPNTQAVVSDSDASNHFGAVTDIAIETLTNTEDADTAPGVLLPEGSAVTWDYQVSNPGNIGLLITEIRDDNGSPDDDSDDFSPPPVIEDGFNVGDANQNNLLDPDEVWLYQANHIATPGQYTNVGRVVGQNSQNGDEADASDPTNHFGVLAVVGIEKMTNGEDADTAPGAGLPVGTTATFTYEASNLGNVALTLDSLIDDNGTPDDASDDFAPAAELTSDGFNVGDTNKNSQLDLEEIWKWIAQREVTQGPYVNVATLTADEPITSQTVTATDQSHHFGAAPQVTLEKQTNGEDAKTAPGPLIAVDATATFNYFVGNEGNVALTVDSIRDDNGTPEDDSDDFSPEPVLSLGGFNIGDLNGNDLVDLDETWQYSATRVVTAGQYSNSALVSTTNRFSGATSSASDTSNHFGSLAEITLQKRTNGEDADEPPGPLLEVGDIAMFDYLVSNAGNVPLEFGEIRDDHGTPDDPTDDFEPTPVEDSGFNIGDLNRNDLIDTDETWAFAASTVVVPGRYMNTGRATAVSEIEQIAAAEDLSHHIGVDATVEIKAFTNGDDADAPTGPIISQERPILFSYRVSNGGNAPLRIDLVQDDNGTPDDPTDDFSPAPVIEGGVNIGDTDGDGILDLDEVWLYEADRIAEELGQFRNVGSVFATQPFTGIQTDDNDASHHFVRRPPGIYGFVFDDLDKDGIFDAEDAPVANVELILTRLDQDAEDVVVFTEVDGSYAFKFLESGIYKITEIQPVRYFDNDADGVGRTDGRGRVINDPHMDMITDIVFGDEETLDDFNFSESVISKRRLLASRLARS